jgi:hypothetical protein
VTKKPITAAELTARLRADPEFCAKQREKEQALAKRVDEYHKEQAPIVADLQRAGIEVEFLSDLIKRSTPYPAAIPVLLTHLVRPYSDVTRETLARALAVPDAQHCWPILATEYRKAPIRNGTGVKQSAKSGLAVALAATASDAVMNELIALAKDQSNGDSRLLLLRGLKKSKNALARRAIEELASDPALAKEIASWKKGR